MLPIVSLHQLCNFDQIESAYHENLRGLQMVEPAVTALSRQYPGIRSEYELLMRRAKMEGAALERIKEIRHRCNLFYVCDLAAAMGIAKWMLDVFVFAQKIRALA